MTYYIHELQGMKNHIKLETHRYQHGYWPPYWISQWMPQKIYLAIYIIYVRQNAFHIEIHFMLWEKSIVLSASYFWVLKIYI